METKWQVSNLNRICLNLQTGRNFLLSPHVRTYRINLKFDGVTSYKLLLTCLSDNTKRTLYLSLSSIMNLERLAFTKTHGLHAITIIFCGLLLWNQQTIERRKLENRSKFYAAMNVKVTSNILLDELHCEKRVQLTLILLQYTNTSPEGH